MKYRRVYSHHFTPLSPSLFTPHQILYSAPLNVKDKREVSTVSLFRTLGWLPIDVRIHYFTAIAMFNIMIGQAPVDLVNMFTQNNSVHDHNTRGGTNIRVKRYNLSIGQRTFAYRGAKVWDNIPEHIKNVTTVECFKTMFLKHVSKEVYECEHLKLTGMHEYVCEFIFVYVCMYCMYARACMRTCVCCACACICMYVFVKLYRCVNACIYYIFILFILLLKLIF